MATKVVLTISDQTYQRAERLAQTGNKDVTEVLADAIVLNEPSPDTTEPRSPETDEDAAVAREGAAFRALHPILREKYKGEHVAIHGGEVVDHDKDPVALSLRIYDRFPDAFVWIAPVKKEPVEVLEFRSPRFVDNGP